MLKSFNSHYKKHRKNYIVCLVGFLFVLVYHLPQIILGENSYILIWDNLDSEIIFNKLNAKYFFNFSGTASELMDIDVRAVNSFSIFQLFFYMIFNPFTSYLLNEMVMRFFAYIGMYLFLNLLFKKEHRFASIVTAIMFAATPFVSVYGLTVVGMPLIAWAFWKIYLQETLVWAYIAVAFFTISSSILLSGYFILVLLIATCIIFAAIKRTRRKQLHFYLATSLMIGLYLLCNLKLILLLMDGYQTHRELWGIGGTVTFEQFINNFILSFIFGHSHVRGFYFAVTIICFAAFILGLISFILHKKKSKNFKLWIVLCSFIALNIAISLLSAFLHTHTVSKITSLLGLEAFNIQRVFFALSFTWYVAGGIAIAIFFQSTDLLFCKLIKSDTTKIKASRVRYNKIIASFLTIVLATITICFSNSFKASGSYENFSANFNNLVKSKKSDFVPTFAQFYDTEIFNEINAYIGRPKNSYRVGSIALHPSVSLYNGFYTVDGYAQSYSLEYWSKFREIIAPELDKDASLNSYYNWGNRCYLFSAEIGKNYLFNKNSDIKINNLTLNIEALKSLGGEYIVSSVPIVNHLENNLEFCGAFEHSNSWWRIHLYRVK